MSQTSSTSTKDTSGMYAPPQKQKDITPILVQQAMQEVPEKTAIVYSVIPHFAEGVISFLVQLSGAPDGFIMNASTTIPTSGLDSGPSSSLVLVPRKMKNRSPQKVYETALIIAASFFEGDYISYYCQLPNGTILKLFGDKLVHDIDLMDPNAPSYLSVIPISTFESMKRDLSIPFHVISATTSKVHTIGPVDCDFHCPSRSIKAYPKDKEGICGCEYMGPLEQGAAGNRRVFEDQDGEVTKEPSSDRRGLEGISAYTVTVTKETCDSMSCTNNGGKAALFNPFTRSCYCTTPSTLLEGGLSP